MKILKPMIVNRGSKRLFLRYKKPPVNTFSWIDLVGETAILNK